MLWRSWRSQQISTLRGHFQSKNLYCRLRGFKAGFLVKGRFGIFLKIHPIWYHHPPQGPSYHTVKIFNIFWTFPLKAFVLKRIEYHRSNLEYLLTYFLLFIYFLLLLKYFLFLFKYYQIWDISFVLLRPCICLCGHFGAASCYTNWILHQMSL